MNREHDYKAYQIFVHGDRVELHPGCDLWMQGARYGEVHGLLPDGHVLVKMDHRQVKQLVNVAPWRLRHI